MPQPPTFVFIPGAWHKPICHSKIVRILESQYNLKCTSITLPSTLGDPHATFKDDLDVAVAAISDETSQSRDVIVVAHSYGGIIGCSAIKDFTPSQQQSHSSSPIIQGNDSAKGHVLALVLIASGFTLTGLSFMDPFFGHPPPAWRVNKATGFADIVKPPAQLFYHDLPTEEADYWTSQLTPQSLKALFEGGEHVTSSWRNVPVWYLGTVEDRGLPVFAQRMQIGMARAIGGVVSHREVRSSHSPFLSLPVETVGVLIEAVEGVTGETLRKDHGEKKQEVVVPRVTFWGPMSWLRFGVPYGLGHLIGRGVLLFQWLRGR